MVVRNYYLLLLLRLLIPVVSNDGVSSCPPISDRPRTGVLTRDVEYLPHTRTHTYLDTYARTHT